MSHAAPTAAGAAAAPPPGRLTRWQRLCNALLRVPAGAASRVRVTRLRLLGMRIGPRCRLGRVEAPRDPWDVELGEGVALDAGVVLLPSGPPLGAPKIVIGGGTYVNRGVFFDASGRIEVGPGCMIGPYCYLTDHDHGTEAGRLVRDQPLDPAAPVRLGRGAWLGAGVLVLKGVEIGEGAVVGAGSVVTRSVPANAVAVGVPARVVRYRE